MLKIITECKNPEILVITPLLTGHTISRETKVSIKRNKIPYIWASFESDRKHAANVQEGINQFQKEFHYLPKYIFILDRDIIAGRYLLDRLYNTLSITNEKVAYTYCGFEYRGYINLKIPPTVWNLLTLKRQNYISSNSLYKTDALLSTGGFITDEDTHRLSDWAKFLQFAQNGYKGVLNGNASFIAMSTEKDISAGNNQEFIDARKLVLERYLK